VRFVSYNIHRAVGSSGTPRIRDVGLLLRELAPDAVALQEIVRTPVLADQPLRLARMLGMGWTFLRTTRRDGMGFGNAVLSRGLLRSSGRVLLPGAGERRGLLLTELEIDGLEFTFGCTHLDPGAATREQQLAALSEALPLDRPLVLAGDFNAEPERLGPLSQVLEIAPPRATYPSPHPRRAIDHVLLSEHWEAVRSFAVPALTSDHAALVVDLAVRAS